MAYREYRNYDSNRDRRKVKYNLIERIGVLSTKDTGWTREVNIVAWNDGEAKVDIREWSPGRDRMSKGITLPHDDAERLVRLLADRYGFRLTDKPQVPLGAMQQMIREPMPQAFGSPVPQRPDDAISQTAGNPMPQADADTDTVPFGYGASGDASGQDACAPTGNDASSPSGYGVSGDANSQADFGSNVMAVAEKSEIDDGGPEC